MFRQTVVCTSAYGRTHVSCARADIGQEAVVKRSLQEILAGNHVIKPLDDLLQIKSIADEPDDDAPTVTIKGLLYARNFMFIGVRSGDMLLQIPVNAVKKATEEKNPPDKKPKYGVYVVLEVIKDAEILMFRKMSSNDFDGKHGALPFVLSTPSAAKDYAAAAALVDAKNTQRTENLKEKLTPVPWEKWDALEPIKSVLPPNDDSHRYSATSPYESSETKEWQSPYETAQNIGNVAGKITDTQLDSEVFKTTDTQSDLKVVKGDLTSGNSPYETFVVTQSYTAYDTLQQGGLSKITDYHDTFKSEKTIDSSSDLLNVE